jgi:AhpD family alkylhydroperoxidase
LALFGTLAHADTAFIPWLTFSGVLLTQLTLDPALRELAILAVAHEEGCEYEWVQHVLLARRAGVPDQKIDAVRCTPTDAAVLTPLERDVVAGAREFVLGGCIGAQRVAALCERLGSRGCVELLLLLGQYQAVARIIASLDIPAEDTLRLGDVGSGGAG